MPPQQHTLAEVVALAAQFGANIGSLLGHVDWTTRASTQANRDWIVATWGGQLTGDNLALYSDFLAAIDAHLAQFPQGG